MADDASEPNEWDEYAAGWDNDEAARAYASAAFESLTGVARANDLNLAGASVLDFGCGTGLLTEQLVAAGARVHAVDSSSAMVDVLDAKVADRGWTTVTTSTHVEPASEPVDLVVCSSVCAFLDDYPGTAALLAAMLKPGGLFVQWDWELVDGSEEPFGLRPTEVVEALAGAGLESVSAATGFSVPFGEHTMAPLMGVGIRPTAS